MRRARNQAHVAAALAVGGVKAADGQQARVFALCAGVGLDGNRIKAGDGFELVLQAFQHFQIARCLIARGKGVDLAEFRPGNRQHFGGGVELHGAGAERNHAAVHRQIALFQLFQVAQHFVLGVVAVEHGMLQDFVLAQQILRQGKRDFLRQCSSFAGKQFGERGKIFGARFFVESDGQLGFTHAAQVEAGIERALVNVAGLIAAFHQHGVEKGRVHHFEAV